MKKLKKLILFLLLLWGIKGNLYAMENPHKYEFSKNTLLDIYEFAGDLSEAIGQSYQIIKQVDNFMTDIDILGISPQDKLLDVKYHYFLLRRELEKGTSVYNTVKNAYNRVIDMLSEIDNNNFRETLYTINFMSLKDIEALKFKNIVDKNQFIEDKKKLIDEKVLILKKESLKLLLDLPENASDDVIHIVYEDKQKNLIDKLVAQQIIGNISQHELKQKITKIEEIKKLYNNTFICSTKL